MASATGDLLVAPARVLNSYVAACGVAREVVAVDGAAGCVLVVDRDALTHGDTRLVAHLCADEPPGNAAVAGADFVREASRRSVRCRAVTLGDLDAAAPAECLDEDPSAGDRGAETRVRDRFGRSFELEAVHGALSIPELRWRCRPQPRLPGRARTVSVREAIEAVEAYEPIRRLTRCAIARAHDRDEISVAVLRLELDRILRSPIVLNCKLRRTVLAFAAERDVSMSEIAIRCGRIKRDRAGNISGETSWLGRRLGILPEGGRDRPTRWIHIEVLALIARRGLGVSPREVEPD